MASSAQPSRQRGAMLIVAMGMLALLSILAAAFWSIMSMERAAATNYLDGKRASFTAEAGNARFVAQAKQAAKEPAFDGGGLRRSIFGVIGPSRKEIDVARPVEEVNPQVPSDAFFYGVTGVSYPGKDAKDEFRLKVVDTSALFDLNFPMEPERDPSGNPMGRPLEGQTLEQMLTALGEAIRVTRGQRGLQAWDPVNGDDPKSRRKSIRFGQYVGARAILAYRLTLDGTRFSAKSQLPEIMEDASYNLLADYVTAHGSVDDFSTEGATFPEPGSHSWVRRLGSDPGQGTVGSRARSMININLAAREVLIAAIAPLCGRRHTFYVTGSTQLMEEKDAEARVSYLKGAKTGQFLTDGDQALKEDYDYAVREGWLYVGPFGVPRAQQVADWIIQNRPFQGYADFHQKLHREMMKSVRRLGASPLDAAMPPARRLGRGDPVTEPGVRIFPWNTAQRDSPRWDLSGIEAQPYFPSLVREAGYAILLANFNPATVAGSAVPNSASFLPVDKGNLLYPSKKGCEDENDGNLYSRQTFDFCYDTMGVFEITSLGQVKKAFGELAAREKLLSVVRILGKMTHRTQWDYELNDALYTTGGAGGGAREGFATFPNKRRIFADPGTPTDVPTNTFAEPDFGHVEVNIRSLYEPDGSPRITLFGAGLGNMLMGSFFDWPKIENSTWDTVASLCAFVADRDKLILKNPSDASGGHDYTQPGGAVSPKPFNEARGKLPKRIGGQSVRTVARGSTPVHNDGVHMSYRSGRDSMLWYRAGAPVDTDFDLLTGSDLAGRAVEEFRRDQGALPLQAMVATDNYRGAPREQPRTGDRPDDSHHRGNIWYRKGGVEFWYKPDFDWAYTDAGQQPKPFPLYCGYVFASRVYYNPGVQNQNYGPNTVDARIRNPEDANDFRGLPTDGTQLYLFRNSLGQIRATRMFFRVVGKSDNPASADLKMRNHERPSRFLDPEAGDTYGNKTHEEYAGGPNSFVAGELDPATPDPKAGAIDVYRRARERRPIHKFTAPTAPNEPKGYPWPPLEFAEYDAAAWQAGAFDRAYSANEKEIQNARVDAYVPFDRLRTWRAGEWHHIAVYWDDTLQNAASPDRYLRIYVDGAKQSETKIVGDEKFAFVRLNEPPYDPATDKSDLGGEAMQPNAAGGMRRLRYPKDQVSVGCIQRKIAATREGVFKHENLLKPGSSGVVDVTTERDLTKEINLFACGTIDDFITYDGTSPPGDTLPRIPKHFEPRGIYVNHFDMRSRLPGGGRPLELARLGWTILVPPQRYSPGVPTDRPVGIRGSAAKIEIGADPGNIKLRAPNGAEGAIVFDQRTPSTSFCFGQLVEAGTDNPALLTPASPRLRYEIELTPTTFDAQGGTTNVPQLPQCDTPALHEVSVFYYLPTEETLLKERIVE